MTLFDRADQAGLRVASSCGRKGTCHECVVEVTSGMESLCERTPAESFLNGNYRLACQAALAGNGDRVAFTPLQRRLRILTNQDADPHAPRGSRFGAAMDLGTTTIVIELVDLDSGAVPYVAAIENPQRFGGGDVMHRISYDSGPHRGELQQSVIHALNNELAAACAQLGIDRTNIVEVFAVGNTTMRDLFFGLDVQPIGQRPYKSLAEAEYRAARRASTMISEAAHRLGILAHPKAVVTGGPLIASHVGADTAAALLATGCHQTTGTVMLVDVGTNTEVVIGHRGRWLAASCPAGPAFEGGLIRHGMPGSHGAIESISWDGASWRCRTIGDAEPVGICGSGFIDLLAELRRHGMMTEKGVFSGRRRELEIANGITFSREDASHLAQAKAANFCGQAILLRTLGIRPEELDRLYLAGAFATHTTVRNAMDIGFLAPARMECVVKAGNAASAGARQMLLSKESRARMEAFVGNIEHVELETTPDFFDCFVEGCQFKPMAWG